MMMNNSRSGTGAAVIMIWIIPAIKDKRKMEDTRENNRKRLNKICNQPFFIIEILYYFNEIK
ncbi:MAG: hypothetical protein LKF47_01375 [Megasphaera sp.]|jgi:hypothetical protein|nr:hypothetical protein [Megasphaera sp.]